MNKDKIKQFMSNNGFYLAVGGISIAAIVAVFLIPNTDGDIENQPDMYAINEEASGEGVEDRATPSYDLAFDPNILENQLEEEYQREEIIVDRETMTEDEVWEETNEELVEEVAIIEEDIVEALNFTSSDSLEWPVSGDVVVPYRDDTTMHWFSEGLGQTMRTLGICISANEGEAVKAVAEGIVEDIVKDATNIETLANVGNVGDVIVMDHGNGYKTFYGVQQGSVSESLIGQRVEAGEVIATVGEPSGPFVSEGINIYLQMTHNGEVINPEEFLVQK